MKHCLVCQNPIDPFIDFGPMPIANGFLTKEQFKDEYFFQMRTAYCPKCHMVQLVDQPERERMFHENYAFFSGTSKRMGEHFKSFAERALEDFISDKDPFVVEMGSNDGIMLQNFAARGIRHLGIEPSANVAKVAQERGIRTICRFFDEQAARDVVAENGNADAFLAANVTCHIPYIHSIAAGARILLKPRGVMMFEDPYLGDVIEKTSYDQIYDEHVFVFSLHSVSAAFGLHGLEVIDVESQSTHGGSMRYVLSHAGARPISPRVAALRAREEALGLTRRETFDRFRVNCERSRDELKSLLLKCRAEGRRVVGYAATSKSTTITNYCGITPDLVDFISDTTPIKQGKFSPGVHIPVRPYEEFKKRYPDYALLFGWNHYEEIAAKEADFRKAGGKWIMYVPKVGVI
jgi:methylation protein EvaC